MNNLLIYFQKVIRERLDSSLMDLQLAITVEEVGNSEKRVHQTARATVGILSYSFFLYISTFLRNM